MAETQIEYVYSGDPTFAVNFNLGYIDRSHITARVNFATDGGGDPVYANFVWVDNSNITITDPLVNGDDILIERTVPKDALVVEFSSGDNVTSSNLDKQALQGLMTYEELIDGRVGDNSPLIAAEEAKAAAVVAAASAAEAEADALLTAADVVATNADVVSTNADVVLTGADVDATNADVLLTNADVVLTNADAVSTGNDVTATNADAAATAADVVLTAADVVLTAADVVDAEAAKAAAAATLIEFETHYLGPYAADPTLDNEGGALAAGALYWNTVGVKMRVYDGTVWNDTVTNNTVLKNPTQTIYDTAGSGTYVPPVDCTAIDVMALGGGGGGGDSDGQGADTAAAAGSGGGGASALKRIANPAASYSYTVGALGAGAISAGTAGSAGGDSLFSDGGSIALVGTGGLGGAGDTGSTSSGTHTNGTAIVLATGGDINIPGQSTATAPMGDFNTSHFRAWSYPRGGDSPYGAGGGTLGTSGQRDGVDGAGHGSGGSGGVSVETTSNSTGGDGTPGLIIIKEYYGTEI